MDLPVPARAPPGDGHGRRRAQAVPLPRCVAYAPRRREVRRHGRVRPRAAGPARARRGRPRRLRRARPQPCVLAAAVRLLEIGFFRIGSEEYAVENASYGLATMRKEHVTIEDGGLMVFDYPAKSGQRRHQGIADERLAQIVGALRRRRSGGPELLAYKARRPLARRALRGHQRVPQGRDGRRLLGEGLPHLERDRARGGGARACRARRRRPRRRASGAINRAVKEVAGYLGNTPAVCRASYIDPRVFDAFDAGLHDPPGARAGRAGRSSRASCRSTSPSWRPRCWT